MSELDLSNISKTLGVFLIEQDKNLVITNGNQFYTIFSDDTGKITLKEETNKKYDVLFNVDIVIKDVEASSAEFAKKIAEAFFEQMFNIFNLKEYNSEKVGSRVVDIKEVKSEEQQPESEQKADVEQKQDSGV